MLKIILVVMCLLSFHCHAGDVFAFSGVYAYDDGQSGTQKDYNGLSPNGYFGIKYRQNINDVLEFETGFKHESSMAYREVGNGFNGVFFEFGFKLF